MNDNESILAELRKISAWVDMQRKMKKWALIFVAVWIAGLVVFGIVMEQRQSKRIESTRAVKEADWYCVDRYVELGSPDKAIEVGEELLSKTPQYPNGHRRLAAAYLAAGKVEKAREHYAEAFRLFPSEENGKLLEAIEARINAESRQPSR